MTRSSRPSRGARIASALNLLLGIWVLSAPFIYAPFGTDAGAIRNGVMVGGGVAMLAALRMISPREAPIFSMVNLMLGIWTFLSPWIYGNHDNSMYRWNSALAGLAIAALAVGSWRATARARRLDT